MSDRLAAIDIGRKMGAAVFPFHGGAGSDTMSPAEAYLRTKWHVDPSKSFLPQYTNVTDRQTGQTTVR